jgi:chromate transporter
LLVATGWVLSSAHSNPAEDWRLWLLTVVVTGVVWRTRVPLLWLIAAGAAVGMLGWV